MMTLPQIISRNQIQKIPTIEINGRVVLQPNTWYTCPTDKKAIVKGKVQCTSRGAAANADFNAAGVLMFSWITALQQIASNENSKDTPRGLTTFAGGQFGFFEVELAAGNTITTTQDSGTNAEFNVWASVQETPA